MISAFKHPWRHICNKNQYWRFFKSIVYFLKPFGFCFDEGCAGKAEINLRKSVSTAPTITILFLLLKLFHAEPSRLGCNFGDALCFPLRMFCRFASSAQLSRVTQMCSAWRETDPDDFLIFVLQRRSLLWSVRRARPWTCPEKPTFCVNRPHVLHKDSHGQLVHQCQKRVFQSQHQKSYCRLPGRFKKILTSSRANTSKIPPTHNFLCPSTTSHSELKLYVFPHSIRCRSILAGVPMSPTTDRPAQKKSPPERKPICVLIHSAGLDMSKQPAFTAVATLFSSNCQAVGLSTHSLNQGWWQQTKHPQPWIEGNKHFSRNT